MTNVVMRGNTQSCPQCGGQADAADMVIDDQGRVHLYEAAWAILRKTTDGQGLERLRDTLQQVRAGEVSQEQAEQAIKDTAPALWDLRPKARSEVLDWIQIILAIITLYLTFAADSAPTVINQTIINQLNQPAAADQATPADPLIPPSAHSAPLREDRQTAVPPRHVGEQVREDPKDR